MYVSKLLPSYREAKHPKTKKKPTTNQINTTPPPHTPPLPTQKQQPNQNKTKTTKRTTPQTNKTNSTIASKYDYGSTKAGGKVLYGEVPQHPDFFHRAVVPPVNPSEETYLAGACEEVSRYLLQLMEFMLWCKVMYYL